MVLGEISHRALSPGEELQHSAPYRAVTVSTEPVRLESFDPAAAPRVQPGLERRRKWEKRYARRVFTTDALIVLTATAVTAAANYLATGHDVWTLARVAGLTAFAWLVMLRLNRSRATEVFGSGAREYKRVVHATGYAFGILAMLFVAFQWQGIRMQLTAALPIGLLALLIGRWSWRRWLTAQRRYGHYASRAIVAGSRDDVEYVIKNLDKNGRRDYIVVGTTISDDGRTPIRVDGRTIPVVGTMTRTAMHARELHADTIIVASRPDSDPDFIKRLSWELEGTAAELILSSRLTDVAGPRISLRPIDGLPLIHVAIPDFEGGKHSLKRAVDVLFATMALIPIALIAPFIALAIKLDSRGPVFFRQTRIGRDGREFRMIKFRTMKVDAEAQLAKLKEQNEGSGPLFKMKNDPRITRVGRVLRKFSLDELPQFVNVLTGDMSVVGPRPPLPSEVSDYKGRVYRRLYIKPGITGLWQVSGRSDLSWEESVRLDLRYVENWSITNDLMIMWRTAQVMVAPKGAY